MIIKDQIQRTIKLEKTPKRIVSLVPSQTELLVDLGLEDSIVGVTKFCVHPNHLRKSKTIVGGTKNVHFKKIKALQPDIILCNKEENTKEIVEACEQIATTHVSNIFTIQDNIELIKQYGMIFNCHEKSEAISKAIKTESQTFQNYIQNHKQLKVAYFIWKNPWMASGSNTFINHLLDINNYQNVFASKERYPEVILEQLQEENPEVIFLSSEPFPFKEKHLQELQQEFPNSRIILVDGEMFSWYGSRLIKAFDYFKKLRERL